MATVEQYVEQASSYVGVSGDVNIFNEWYWCELNGYSYIPPFAWCASFQSYVGVRDLGMPFNPSASAAGVAWQGREIPDSEAQRGDWVLFNWDGRQDFSWADHIGLLTWSDINGSGYFGTVEGNTGSGPEGEVAFMTRNNYTSYATKFFRPPYREEQAPQPEQIPGSAVNDLGFWYRLHCQNLGWCPWVHDGQVAGTTGFGLRWEAIEINPPEGWELEAIAHIQNIGWVRYTGITHNSGVIIGTTGKALRIEMFGIRVVKAPANAPKLEFRVHQQNVGWKGWTPEGFASGTDGQETRLEAVQIQAV